MLEDAIGAVVGIEVKAAATVTAADFKGLRKLAEAAGDGFRLGLVLYDGDRLHAAPLSCLWSA